MQELDEQQQAAVNQLDGPVFVSAGAGTGKTRVLTHRIAHLINSKKAKAQNILAVTFTNKAANEMKERVIKLCGEDGYGVTISTFHSLCAKILRQHIHLLADGENKKYNRFFSIYDDKDKSKVIKKIVASLFKNNSIEKNETIVKNAIAQISKAKSDNIFPKDFLEHFDGFFVKEVAAVYEEYEKELARSNALDFDDLIIKTIVLFLQHQDVLDYYQNLYKYIHIDEFQDSNMAQNNFAMLLADKHRQLFIVGDEDQSIYAFRGAHLPNLKKFVEEFKYFLEPVKVYRLEYNYRSTKQILGCASKLINENCDRIIEKKNLFTTRDGEEVVSRTFENDYREADFIASTIWSLYNKGKKLSDFAVFYRINATSRPIEQALSSLSIPYVIYRGLAFFERVEIKNILNYLRLLVNSNDDEACRSIINFPKRGVGDATIEKINEQANISMQSFFDLCHNFEHKGVKEFVKFFDEFAKEVENSNLFFTVKTLIDMLDFANIYSGKNEDDHTRLLNIKSFLTATYDFCENNANLSVQEFLESITLNATDNKEAADAVVLSTVHGVKGLEFDTVFIAGFEEGLIPYRLSVEEGNLEEERRLAYVAITRAKNKLYITRPEQRYLFGKGENATMPSRFLHEMGLEKRAEIRPTFSHQQKNKVELSEYTRPAPLKTAEDMFREQKAKNMTKNFAVHTRVKHAKFGIGIIESIENKNATIVFDDGSTKLLNLDYAPLEII